MMMYNTGVDIIDDDGQALTDAVSAPGLQWK